MKKEQVILCVFIEKVVTSEGRHIDVSLHVPPWQDLGSGRHVRKVDTCERMVVVT